MCLNGKLALLGCLGVFSTEVFQVVRVTAYNVLQHKTHSSFLGGCKAWEIFMRVIGGLDENTGLIQYPATPRGTDMVM